eukprot:Hpha_TRINITY_DN32219_c0_g1::TRINITY_DN32219_c0_g1_i1::g.155157::m.155157
MADRVTHDEKAAMVYDELDARKTRAPGLDAWRSLFLRLDFDFSDASLADLFSKADADRDGAVAYGEFQRWCDGYPTLLDCLYYRARDYWLDQHQVQCIHNGRAELGDLKSRSAAARAAHDRAADESTASAHALQLAERRVVDAEDREKEAQERHKLARAETQGARDQLRAQTAELAQTREAERTKEQGVRQAVDEVGRKEQQVRHAGAEVGKAVERLEELLRMVEQQRREVENREKKQRESEDELGTARAQEDEGRAQLADAQSATAKAVERVGMQEVILRDTIARERNVSEEEQEANGDTHKARQAVAQQSRELVAAQDAEARAKSAHILSEEACDTQQQHLKEQEDENAKLQAHRRKVADEERPLVEQEVRLREQRDCLESKENELRARFENFSTAARQPGDASPLRSSVPSSRHGASPQPVPPHGASVTRSYHSTSPPGNIPYVPSQTLAQAYPAPPLPQRAVHSTHR